MLHILLAICTISAVSYPLPQPDTIRLSKTVTESGSTAPPFCGHELHPAQLDEPLSETDEIPGPARHSVTLSTAGQLYFTPSNHPTCSRVHPRRSVEMLLGVQLKKVVPHSRRQKDAQTDDEARHAQTDDAGKLQRLLELLGRLCRRLPVDEQIL